MFVSEHDGTRDDIQLEDPYGHSVIRHYPGPVSWPMSFIMHKDFRRYIRKSDSQGRSMSITARDPGKFEFTLIGVHGGHGDTLHASLGDAAALYRRAPSTAYKYLVGDWNVDLLPLRGDDPYRELLGREDHHGEQRRALHSLLDAFDIAIHQPTVSHGSPGGSRASEVINSIVSRVPLGAQSEKPSLLDFCVTKAETNVQTELFWLNDKSDHAALRCVLPGQFRKKTKRGRTTWRCSSWNAAISHVNSLRLECFKNADEFSETVKGIMVAVGDGRSAAARRKTREPPVIKDLRRLLRTTVDPVEVLSIRRQIWEARVHWLRTLKDMRQRHSFEAGKPRTKSKKLFPLTQLEIDGERNLDHDKWASEVSSSFRQRWRCNRLQQRENIMQALARHCGESPSFTGEEWHEALDIISRPFKTDQQGICPFAIRLLFFGAPEATIAFFNNIISSDDFFHAECVYGHAKAKKRGLIPAEKIRIILPLSSILTVIDAAISNRLNKRLEEWASRLPPSFLECAKKRRQIQDVTFAVAQHIEKGIDNHGRAAVCQADIKQYYDHLDPLKIWNWITHNLSEPGLATAILRLHVLPTAVISVGTAESWIQSRTSGMLTGSRSAGSAGRIPLMDAALALSPTWPGQAASYGQICCGLGTFVDNLVTLSINSRAGMALLDQLEAFLVQNWGLTFGDDSRMYVIAAGGDGGNGIGSSFRDWKGLQSMRILGHGITSNKSIMPDIRNTIAAMWACFYANLSPSLRSASFKAKMNFLQRCVKPLAAWKWSQWPFTKTGAIKLDQCQTHMISILVPVHALAHEQPLDYFARRSRICGRMAKSAGKWSIQWAESLPKWKGHYERDHSNCEWNPAIATWHDQCWLEAQRRNYTGANATTRTRTRSTIGRVLARWHETVAVAGIHALSGT